jgi:hypothetical protein
LEEKKYEKTSHHKRIILLLLAISLCGCSEESVVFGTGEIKYIDLEGGFYGIVSDNGEHYDSINLPLEFKEDSLQAEFKLKIM